VVALKRDDDEKVVSLRDFKRERAGGKLGFHRFSGVDAVFRSETKAFHTARLAAAQDN
jgi:hypothetical protein